jgi:hypothetical protein
LTCDDLSVYVGAGQQQGFHFPNGRREGMNDWEKRVEEAAEEAYALLNTNKRRA